MIVSSGGRPTRTFEWERTLDRVLGGLAAAILFSMMALTACDVIGRYVFSAPVPGGFEITELMMAVLTFAGLPLVTAKEEHVTIDMLDHVVPRGLQPIQRQAMSLIGAVWLAAVSWRLWVKAGQTLDLGDMTAELHVPLAGFAYFMATLTALTSLVLLLRAYRPGRARGTGEI